ncbi:hypothetical protein EIQ06_00535 [Xanthomonas campestris pv. campestris]
MPEHWAPVRLHQAMATQRSPLHRLAYTCTARSGGAAWRLQWPPYCMVCFDHPAPAHGKRNALIRPGFPRHLKAMENGGFGGAYEQQAIYG